MTTKKKRSFIRVLPATMLHIAGAVLAGCIISNPPGSENTAAFCADGIDNDLDGSPDCFDIDCLPFQCNPPPPTELCTGGIDDDFDGTIDCDDSDCAIAINCQPLEICDNTLDDDGDGLTDCGDPECTDLTCGGGEPLCVPHPTENLCTNGTDDDSDGFVDCSDIDCINEPFCADNSFPENCTDGADNNGNSLTDCEDPSCFHSVACNCPGFELCGNNIDDNSDGLTDCQDTSCGCPEICGNGLDDNGDQITDCQDFSCLFDPNATDVNGNPCLPGPGSCDAQQCLTDVNCIFFDPCCLDPQSFECTGIPIELCIGGADEDNDGTIDCADTDCAIDANCIQGTCANPLSTPGTPITTDTSNGIDNDSSELCAVNFGAGFKDLIFAINSPTTTTFNAALTSTIDLGMYARTACNDFTTELACVNNALTDETLSAIPINANETVFLSVDGVDAEGSFTLTVTLQ